jgi:hypothetical protein
LRKEDGVRVRCKRDGSLVLEQAESVVGAGAEGVDRVRQRHHTALEA